MNKPQLGAILTKAPSCRGRPPPLDMHIHKKMADLAECSTPCNHWHSLLVWDSELKSESWPNCLSCRERPPSLDKQKLWYILLAAFAECSTPSKTRHSLIDQTAAPCKSLDRQSYKGSWASAITSPNQIQNIVQRSLFGAEIRCSASMQTEDSPLRHWSDTVGIWIKTFGT